MKIPKINFLDHTEEKKANKKNLLPRFLFYPLIFLAIFILIFTFQVIFSGEGVIKNLGKINIFQSLGFTTSTDKMLQGENNDRINILLLGMGGEGHPGPYLTDTMIIASIKPSENKVALISIPRDLSVPIPGYGWRKINNANHFGEMKEATSGPKFAAQVVSEVFDIPIDYYLRVDFSGFEKLIDELGGVKINVENSFVDDTFPTDDYGFQTVSFKQGWQKMDGLTALNYARSRHGTNNENSDFARSKRQQQVLQAIKDEALSFTTFLSYRKISSLIDMYKDHVVTNLDIWEIYKLVKIAKKIDGQSITNLVIDNGENGPLYATNINGAYLLLPRDMSFYQVQQMIKLVFDPAQQIKAKEKVKVEIQNGTKIEGLAYQTSVNLKGKGFEVAKISNAQKQDLAKTIIYDLTNGQKTEELGNLKNYLKADATLDKPSANIIYSSNIDFLIILGQDQ
ncbi:MAG: LCP family protein, partial [Candidatus Parcubacteria bacterium]|nr:LCP family protein [Candidatus Parcubacteria bacterium]